MMRETAKYILIGCVVVTVAVAIYYVYLIYKNK